ncbi:hypothetical protein BJ508DRAFT_322416 [Ascobolus immersus RN42]|uniref:Uncharacterized protein n=1 Tax=Ascobolus immersus RN42 TaxID=1160509 RepID=A0A3N4II49_ASCIM|nr:hypothetical protein BJ508DRAFT_322416 [Ascobolus immersus RN42]
MNGLDYKAGDLLKRFEYLHVHQGDLNQIESLLLVPLWTIDEHYNGPRDRHGCRTHLPPPLFPSVERYLHFYITNLEPYLFARLRLGHTEHIFIRLIAAQYLFLVDHLSSDEEEGIARRHGAGLLRENQIKLIKIVMQNIVEEVRVLLEHEKANDPQKDWIIGHLTLVVTVGSKAIVYLVGNDRFRSERLELLLLRYCDEEGRNEALRETLKKVNAAWYSVELEEL